MLSNHGMRCISMNFPVMFPPQPMQGFMIPGFVPHRHLHRAMYPPGLFVRLRHIPEINLREIAVDFEEERRSVQVLAEDRYEEWIRFHIRRERQWFEVLRHLMETESWDLSAVVFDGVDKLQHICWRFIDDRLYTESSATRWERKVRQLCLDYFRQLDDMIARLVDLAGRDVRVLFASDHGFGPSDEIFYVNTWLSQQGYLAWRDDVPLAEEGMLNTEGMKTPAFLFDWDRTHAYTLTPGSNGIYLRSRGGEGDGASAGRSGLRDALIDRLLAIESPVTGERLVRRVMKREEVFPGSAMHLAPDLTLVLRDFGFVSVLRSDVAVKPRHEIVGAHRPEGIFLATGPGVRAGAEHPELSILDVTPALMHGLSLPIPEDFEGRLPSEIFEPGHAGARPAHTVAPDTRPKPDAEGPAVTTMDSEGEAIVLERLRSLGYLE
jgi:predicted AlkP superfamily phosphohydrolase/phosphomutase